MFFVHRFTSNMQRNFQKAAFSIDKNPVSSQNETKIYSQIKIFYRQH